MKDISEEKKPDDLPEYEDEDIDYALNNEDMANQILDDVGIENYDNVKMTLEQEIMTPKKSKAYLRKVISDAINKRNKLNGYKASLTKKFKSMEISEAEKQSGDKRIENREMH